MLLVGRSLPTGVPWDLDEDRRLVARERALWAALTPEEQTSEQSYLVALWKADPEYRSVECNPQWGAWVGDLQTFRILDEAFGLPRHSFRPDPKGPPEDVHPSLREIVDWLWTRGFQVIDFSPAHTMSDNPSLTISIPSNRLIPESDRLLGFLGRKNIQVEPFVRGARQVQMQVTYDPVSGRALIELYGVVDSMIR